jgi:hypothetical protein
MSRWMPPSRLLSRSYLLLCAGLLLLLHGTHPLDSDEGLVLHGAWSILNGRVLYNDFFEYVAPGSFYLVAAAFKLLGAHFHVARSIGIVAIAAAAFGVYRISELLLSDRQARVPRWATLFGPLVLCLYSGYWPAINHNTFNLALLVWGSFFVCRSIVRAKWTDAGLGGVISGFGILFLQHRGAVLAATAGLALCVLYARDRSAIAGKSAIAFISASALPVAGLFLFWPPSLLFDSLIRFPATHYLEVNRVEPSLFLITTSFLLAAAWLLRRGRGRADAFMLALQFTLLLSALQRADLNHLTSILFPLLALFPVLLKAATGAARIERLALAWVAAGLVFLNIPMPFHIAFRYSTPFFEKSEHPALRMARERCTASPYIYAGPFAPGYYFETGKLNPTRYSLLLTGFNTSDQFAQALADIQARQPQCMLTNYELAGRFGHDRNNVVDEYIARNYEVAYQFGRIQVWMAPPPRPR